MKWIHYFTRTHGFFFNALIMRGFLVGALWFLMTDVCTSKSSGGVLDLDLPLEWRKAKKLHWPASFFPLGLAYSRLGGLKEKSRRFLPIFIYRRSQEAKKGHLLILGGEKKNQGRFLKGGLYSGNSSIFVISFYNMPKMHLIFYFPICCQTR